jgi:7-carboxy-7-deazaguanine synthase
MANSQSNSIPRDERLRVTEIFYSLQGESRPAGLPTAFIRLTGCPLRCQYCDTEYAFHGGRQMPVADILVEIEKFGTRYVCVTGGEPLAQPNCLSLLSRLADSGFRVSLETSGALDISHVDKRVTIVMDIKTPGSGELNRNRWENLEHLKSDDQIKFVLCDRGDYEWARDILSEHDLTRRVSVLFSPAWAQGIDQSLAEWILEDRIEVRFQMQLHKILWGEIPGH